MFPDSSKFREVRAGWEFRARAFEAKATMCVQAQKYKGELSTLGSAWPGWMRTGDWGPEWHEESGRGAPGCTHKLH